MAQAKTGDHVRVHFTGKLNDGTVFATSTETSPLEFTLGGNEVLPGIEEAVAGMEPGQTKTVEIASDQAYGARHDELKQEIPRESLPEDLEPEVGQQLRVDRPGMQPLIVSVSDISDASVTIDGNHPLAGRDLTFDLELVEIGEAGASTPE
jgi:peptidylprolyl isomerase